ncbi:MAG: PIN domain-containing protein [Nanoarchaeota archaeon]
MPPKPHYVDTCIWLNLFKKEGDETKGIPYWKLAEDFIEQVEEDNDSIIVSTISLKELTFKLGDKFNEVKRFFQESDFIQIIKTTPDDYDQARQWEQEHRLLSFYDYLHVAIAKRLNVPLITRDKDLMEFAKKQVEVFKPEDLLR